MSDNTQLANALRSLRNGDLTSRLDESELGDAAREYNLLVEHFSLLQSEICRVSRETGIESYLGGQAEVPDAAGAWRELVDTTNLAAKNLTIQIRAAAMVSRKRAEGDYETILTLPVTGEMSEMFASINAIRN